MDNLLSAKKVAEILGCSERHVHYLIAKKKLSSFRDGIVRISESDLENYIQDHIQASKQREKRSSIHSKNSLR